MKFMYWTCLQNDVSALHEALAVDDAVNEDAGDLYAALLQAHGQTLQCKIKRGGIRRAGRTNIFLLCYSSSR